MKSKNNTLANWADRRRPDPSMIFSAIQNFFRLILITAYEFKHNELSLRSGALTYTILLSLVPMLAMSTAIVKGLGGGDPLREVAYTYIETLEQSASTIIPQQLQEVSATDPNSKEANSTKESPAKLTEHLRSAIDQLFDYVDRTDFATLGTVGVIGILLSVALVLNHIESAMNAIWKVANGRSILRKISDYLTLLILMPLSISVTFTASAFLKTPQLASKIDILIPFIWMQALILKLVPIFFIALTLYVIYIFFPNTKVKTFPAIFGSLLAAILWFSMQNIYITLQIGVANYNAIYGSFATLPLFLVWMYLGWIFILTGAQVAFAFQNVSTYRLTKILTKPSINLAAALDIMDLVYSSFQQKNCLTAQKLQLQLPEYPTSVLDDVLELLHESSLIHLSQTNRQLLPAEPIESFNRQRIIGAILGAEAPDTTGGNMSLQAIEKAGENLPTDAISRPTGSTDNL